MTAALILALAAALIVQTIRVRHHKRRATWRGEHVKSLRCEVDALRAENDDLFADWLKRHGVKIGAEEWPEEIG